MSGRITKRSVDALELGAPGTPDRMLWDCHLQGFGVRCRKSGKRYYVLKYRIGGRQRWYTIGTHGSPWTPETARRELIIGGALVTAFGTADPVINVFLNHSPARLIGNLPQLGQLVLSVWPLLVETRA